MAVGPALLYADACAGAEHAELQRRLGDGWAAAVELSARRHQRRGQWLWLARHRPDLATATAVVAVGAHSYVVGRMTGTVVADPSAAATTGCHPMSRLGSGGAGRGRDRHHASGDHRADRRHGGADGHCRRRASACRSASPSCMPTATLRPPRSVCLRAADRALVSSHRHVGGAATAVAAPHLGRRDRAARARRSTTGSSPPRCHRRRGDRLGPRCCSAASITRYDELAASTCGGGRRTVRPAPDGTRFRGRSQTRPVCWSGCAVRLTATIAGGDRGRRPRRPPAARRIDPGDPTEQIGSPATGQRDAGETETGHAGGLEEPRQERCPGSGRTDPLWRCHPNGGVHQCRGRRARR